MLGIASQVFLPSYLASHLRVSLLAVSGAYFLVRILDVVVDPVLGQLMDRTTTALGRYRPWMLAGAPILMLATYHSCSWRPRGSGAATSPCGC